MPVGRDGHGQQEQAWGRQQQLVTGKGRGALNPPRGGWGRGRQHCSRRWWWQTHPATTAFLSHWGSEKGQGHLCRALVLAANHHGSQLVPGCSLWCCLQSKPLGSVLGILQPLCCLVLARAMPGGGGGPSLLPSSTFGQLWLVLWGLLLHNPSQRCFFW